MSLNDRSRLVPSNFVCHQYFFQKAPVHGKVQKLYEYMTYLMFEDTILHVAMKIILTSSF